MGLIRRTVLMGLASLLLVNAGIAVSGDDAVVADYRSLREQLDAGQIRQAESRLARLRDTPLAGHATMAVLRAKLDEVAPEHVERFLARYSDITGIDAFRVAWMRELAERERWQRLATTYRAERDVHVRCAVVRARRELGQTQAAIELALKLWHVGYRQPQSCNKAFDLLAEQGELTSGRVRERMRLALAAGNPGIVRAYLDRLPQDQQSIARNWLAVYEEPARAAELGASKLGSAGERRTLLVSAFRKLARVDARQAHGTWNRVQTAHPLPDSRGPIERAIALQAVYDATDAGTRWLNALPDQYANSTVHAWRVRDALRDPDWPAVRAAVRGMPDAQASKPRWRYWRARALQATGAGKQAARTFEALAEEFAYHGFLAADAIGAAYRSGDDLPAANADRRLQVASHPRLHRALLLHRAGHEATAIPVWRRAINELGEAADRLAAAHIASEHDWPWAAMFASGRGGHHGASPLRFPRGYTKTVAKASQTHGIPESWIQALIRQESAFRNTACSSAGACGVTQLMPGTGRWMLDRLGRSGDNLSDKLTQPEHNIAAGVGYLGYLRERFDHPVTALAAYNAGPTTVRRWLGELAAPPGSARWIETLPFGETRDYVIGVLFNRAVYDLLANQRTERLSALLRTVTP